MTELKQLEELAEQNQKNIEALAEKLGADRQLEDDVGGAKWASVFGMPHQEEKDANKSSSTQVAELMQQNAKNLVVLAEVGGVSKHRIAGEATSSDFSKVFGFGGGD